MKNLHFRRLSIKGRITLWYAALLMLILAAVVWALSSASDRAAMAYYEETLRSASVILQDEMEVEHGLLEIDDDIDDVPNVYASLFDEGGELIYGRKWVSLPFEEGAVRLTHEGSHRWYVYDTYVAVPGYESVWLRMHMSSDVSDSVRASVLHDGVYLLPLLAVITLLGGYLITARAFLPIRKMRTVADSIVSGEDLSARIPLDAGVQKDELYALGETVNGMLARLEDAFRRETQFTSDAAHELRTPLIRMITQGEYALSLENMQGKDDALVSMLDSAQEMNALVSHLLLLARMESGQLPREDLCDLSAMLCEIAEDMLPLMQERSMTLRLSTLQGCVMGNRRMLARTAINLIDNAIRYGREGGEISISMQRSEDTLSFTVHDDGPGLSEDDAKHVFTRFWRSDSARTTEGTGIGLSLVAACAKAHGGSACVKSEPGQGAAFTVTLPMYRSSEAAHS